jgi:guanylate kinase
MVSRGRLYVIAAPSGAGKTSLVAKLLERKPQLRLSISHTTRKKRPTEEEGREYYFVSVPEFLDLEKKGAFLEHARVFDNFYATGRATVERFLDAGQDVILEIDWQGARQVREAMPDAQTIFILPPSRQSLEKRLRSRNTDSEEVIQRRLRDSVHDISHWKEFDYVVVNDHFERAVSDLIAIVERGGDHLRRDRADLKALLTRLLSANP